jgi:transposase
MWNDMRKDFLNKEEYESLRKRHRIKAVLLSHQGWTYKKIFEALFWDEETISKHVEDFISNWKLSIKTGGSSGKLSEAQKNELLNYLEKHIYAKSAEICEYVKEKYGVVYAHRGMANFLKFHGFSYKKPKPNPRNVDPAAQMRFVNGYKELVKSTPEAAYMFKANSFDDIEIASEKTRVFIIELPKVNLKQVSINDMFSCGCIF